MKKNIGILVLIVSLLFLQNGIVFALTATEKERYEDYYLEYDEIEYLISNYNVTVQNNNRTLSDFKADSGLVADDLREQAEVLYNEAARLRMQADSYQGTADVLIADGLSEGNNKALSGYGQNLSGLYSGAAELEVAARKLEREADFLDSASVDQQMYQIQFDQVKAELVKAVQELYIEYWQSEELKIYLETVKGFYQSLYDAEVIKQELGFSKTSDVLTIKNELTEVAGQSQQLELKQQIILHNINLLIGRDYHSPLILVLDDNNFAMVSAVTQPEEQLSKAIGNSYALRYARRELGGLSSANDRKSKNAEINQTETEIASHLEQQFQQIKEGQDVLARAENLFAEEELRFLEYQQKYCLELISQLEYQQQEIKYREQQKNVALARWDYFALLEAYQWIVKGL